MGKQCHYITRTYWNLRQEGPKLTKDGIYELCRSNDRYNLRPYYFDENGNIINNFNQKKSNKNSKNIPDPEKIMRDNKKKRKYCEAQLSTENK